MAINSKKIALFCMVAVFSVVGCHATLQQDEQDCADQLTNLASCIPYVSGSAAKPTPECCQNTKKVKANKPKCLCVLIIESTDPSMGLPVNTTLALQMASACDIDAKVSDCPSILNLPADLANAKIFKEAGTSDSTATTTTSSSTDSQPTPSSGSSSSTSTDSTSNTGSKTASSTTNNAATKKISCMGGIIIMAFAALMFLN
ncbi:non-specific lipid transfer protein GPI-anchored 14-like [Mercurialis annua]|uniref:non-specific lipid transfer protein GPI-anchored 14-like n=1 Tax=Mercurialis annua TaxID=3986 RepID=UPI00215FB696|nr:non-specific lipid transfer protein GPI-anchored 14-like [Mercurialis annua]